MEKKRRKNTTLEETIKSFNERNEAIYKTIGKENAKRIAEAEILMIKGMATFITAIEDAILWAHRRDGK